MHWFILHGLEAQAFNYRKQLHNVQANTMDFYQREAVHGKPCMEGCIFLYQVPPTKCVLLSKCKLSKCIYLAIQRDANGINFLLYENTKTRCKKRKSLQGFGIFSNCLHKICKTSEQDPMVVKR